MEALDRLEKHWRWWLLLVWLAAAALMIFSRWAQIRGFGLGDTDDNLRIMQVRDLLRGQDWYDLRQYRLNPPFGADVHWSRLVDLPIAGIKLVLAPLIGGAAAERWAVATAPLLPLLAAMGALAVAARRLVAPQAFALAIALFLCGHSARNQFVPLRIDHHGWQLALVAVAVMALADPKRARGGAMLGIATALSFSIGLEMLLYFALTGAAAVLMWVHDARQARRLAAYGASLAGGSAAGYLLFASYANRAPVCDALSPVWLSALVAAGAVCVILAILPRRGGALGRFGAAALGGLAIAGFFALAWPHCLGRLEGVSPELDRLWLSHVREARPVYLHGWRTAVTILALPAAGLAGYALMLWRSRGDIDRFVPWAAVAAPAVLAVLLLFWQSRAGPAAQLLAVPGATALAWTIIPSVRSSRLMLVRVVGTVGAFLLISGLLVQEAVDLIPQNKARSLPAVGRANASCPSMGGLRAVALQPKGHVLTFVDLGPRLIAVTHHDAVAGPYHRNQADILDTMRAFRGTAEGARAIVERRAIDYVLICPNLSESTIYATEAKTGFYMQLNKGDVPGWLEPVALPEKSPYKMWRVKR
ncbi:MAG TPA: AcrB/AcrD/AcrF family protein [Allosphingosinicella sp.]|nr:AcrB/AcrD/AcrF family protein [Allosphingosinicella sp.]